MTPKQTQQKKIAEEKVINILVDAIKVQKGKYGLFPFTTVTEDIISVIAQTLADQRKGYVEGLRSIKRTMAHIEGTKRVETDYVLLSEANKLIEQEEGE